MSPLGYPSAWLRPRRARFRFARQVHFSSILAPPRPEVSTGCVIRPQSVRRRSTSHQGSSGPCGPISQPVRWCGSLRIRACLLEREQLKYFSGSVVALGTRTVFVADSFFMRHDLTIADMAEWPRIGVPRYSMSKGETLRLLTRAALLLCLLVAVPLHSSGQIQVLQITSSATLFRGCSSRAASQVFSALDFRTCRIWS